jgi:hypothetical protein
MRNTTLAAPGHLKQGDQLDFDVFVSHASEDKERFVRPLVSALDEAHLSVWFDENELRPGDSLIQAVEKGLARSRFAIVVLSPAFFAKRWPRTELDALASRELATGDSVLLPIWLDVDADAVREYSPLLANRYAIIGERGVDYTAGAIAQRIRPGRSPIVLARDELADAGISTPPPSDSWWLEVVESATETGDGPHSGLYRWGFPMPYGDKPEERGRRLAQAVLRDAWKWEADHRPITQITEPAIVHEFIEEMPGLLSTCEEHPHFLVTYAPQLLIPGFGGRFEGVFEEMLAEHPRKADRDLIGLHNKTYEGFRPGSITCDFVQGPLMGPQVLFYDHIDYFFWVLSEESRWLPDNARKFLRDGFVEWEVWVPSGPRDYDDDQSLSNMLFDAREVGRSSSEIAGLHGAISTLATKTVSKLDLHDDPNELARRLIASGAVERWLARNAPDEDAELVSGG